MGLTDVFKPILFITFTIVFQTKNAWRLLNCEQEDANEPVITCNNSDWKITKQCLAKLSDSDVLTYSLMMGLVGPTCTYLKTENGFYSAVVDTWEQVKLSFTIYENEQFTMSYLGKVAISQFLPMYRHEFYLRQFSGFPLWFISSYIYGGATRCHLAVVGLFCLEVIIVAIRRSFLGFIFSLIYGGDHLFVLILRYITAIVQAYGCSDCYTKMIATILFFIPNTILDFIDYLRTMSTTDLDRDSRGRFTRKTK